MHSKKLQSSVSTPKHKKCSETLKHEQEKCIGKPLGRQLARRSKHFPHVWTLSRRLTKLGWNSGQQLREWTSFNPGSTLSCGCLNFLQFLEVQNSCLATALPLEIDQSTVIMDLLLQSAWRRAAKPSFVQILPVALATNAIPCRKQQAVPPPRDLLITYFSNTHHSPTCPATLTPTIWWKQARFNPWSNHLHTVKTNHRQLPRGRCSSGKPQTGRLHIPPPKSSPPCDSHLTSQTPLANPCAI